MICNWDLTLNWGCNSEVVFFGVKVEETNFICQNLLADNKCSPVNFRQNSLADNLM